jgi:protein TonB
MSNDGSRLNTAWLDEPNARIAVVTVVAFGLWCAALILVGRMLFTPDIEPPPPNLDARLVEIEPPPPPAPTLVSTPEQAAPTHPRSPPSAARAAPPRVPHVRPVREEPSQQHAAPALPTTPPAAFSPGSAPPPAVPSPTPSAPPLASATPPASAASRAPAATDLTANALGHTGARAITQPLPEIPDDLRDAAYHAIALVRFSIHPDGSVDVQLLQATQQPRLNQLLLAALHKWRFFPATEDGKPVESHQDVRVHLVVQ